MEIGGVLVCINVLLLIFVLQLMCVRLPAAEQEIAVLRARLESGSAQITSSASVSTDTQDAQGDARQWCPKQPHRHGRQALEGFCESFPPWHAVCMHHNPSTDKCHPHNAEIQQGNPWHNGHRFEALYPQLLERHRKRTGFTILEIGTANGGSLQLWEQYFTKPRMYFVELDPKFYNLTATNVPLAKGFHGSATDWNFMREVVRGIREPIDMVIDDSSHQYPATIDTFRFLFPHLRSGGIYVIEDLNCCYTAAGPQDRSVCQTAKQLVDVLNRRNYGDGRFSLLDGVDHEIQSIHFADEIVAFHKL
eukprot:TRINITY_DN3609_c0_g1_i1.p1 TRINITY_DN3609_c0_g1~~TRINITY_DN3609_c0_g1_i1.p1  ORF type:complete len:315 (+),score=44.01 TRINITY_DN3609_c0_g1_i1:30-947(+)